MYKAVFVCGMPGSGKSVLADYLAGKGYRFIRFGQVVLDEVIKRNLKPSEKNQNFIRNEIRKKYGKAGIAAFFYPQIKKILNTANIVVDGLYSWSEYKYLKTKLGNRMLVVAVFSPPDTRYKRLSGRYPDKNDKKLRNHHFSVKDAKIRDFNEIEKIEKGGPIAMADYTILNTKTLKDFKKNIENIFSSLLW